MQIFQFTTAAGESLQLHFDLGTGRVFNRLTNIDPINGKADNKDGVEPHSDAAYIFAAAYQRSCNLRKVAYTLSLGELLETFYELNAKQAVEITKMFTSELSLLSEEELKTAMEAKPEAKEGEKEPEKNV